MSESDSQALAQLRARREQAQRRRAAAAKAAQPPPSPPPKRARQPEPPQPEPSQPEPSQPAQAAQQPIKPPARETPRRSPGQADKQSLKPSAKPSGKPPAKRVRVRPETDDVTQLRQAGTATPTVSIAPHVLKSRFVLEDQLGSGGMGTVYRAKDLRKVEAQDRHPYLAIKVLNSSFREHPDAFIALQREAARSQSLSHPNIVSIYDFDKHDDVPFMTMELLGGDELAQLLKRFPQGLPEQLAWPVIEGLCNAMRHAHAEGLIHADLKPGNVFVTHTGHAKVLDFGLARAVHANLRHGVLQTRRDIHDKAFDPDQLGALTPAYASREVLGGASPGPADDIFAAGLVIYQVLTGRHAYNRIPADRVDERSVLLERPEQISNRRWRVLQAALALDASKRLASMAALHDGLFGKSPLLVQSVVGGLCALALSVSTAYLWQTNELQEVQQQVVVAAQEAKVEERHDRMVELLREPIFDDGWEQQVAAELTRLAALPESGELFGDTQETVAKLYEGQIIATGDLGRAAELLDRGLAYGPLTTARADLEVRFAARLEALLEAPRLTQDWLAQVEEALIAQRQYGGNSQANALAELAVNDAYLMLLTQPSALPDSPQVQSLLALLQTREFEADLVTRATEQLQRNAEMAAERAAWSAALQTAGAMLASLAPPDCGLTAPESNAGTSTNRTSATTTAPASVVDPVTPQVRAALDHVAYNCAGALLMQQPAVAAELRQAVLARFGELPQLQALRVDSCLPAALLDAGAATDRFCQDLLGVGLTGPQLVVVPGVEDAAAVARTGPFAIARYELSAHEYAEFCEATGQRGCPDAASNAIAGLDVAQLSAYLDWLTKASGFRYRLPTLAEWRWVATAGNANAVPDPNRNCRLELAGVVRGGTLVAPTLGTPNAFGLVNVLGNLQEWVTNGAQQLALGGHFDDPLDQCHAGTIREISGSEATSQLTGVRLVRELSVTALSGVNSPERSKQP